MPDERIIESRSALRHPRALARAMVSDLVRSRRLGLTLFRRDMRAQSRESFSGVLSFFLPPLLSAGLLLLLQRARMVAGGAPRDISPALFVLCGTIYWQLFLDLLLFPLRTAEDAKPILLKISFPREALVIAALARALANFALRFGVLAIFFFPGFERALLALLAAAPLAGFGLVLGIVCVPLGLLFRDFAPALAAATSFLLIVTPVGFFVADADVAPLYFRLNPLTYLVGLPRALYFRLPTEAVTTALGIGLASALLLLAAWLLLRIAMPHVAERLGT